MTDATAIADMIDRWADVWFGFVLGLGFSTVTALLFLRGGK